MMTSSSPSSCQSTSDDLLPVTDRAVYALSASLLQPLHYFNVTPNYITSLSLLFALIAMYSLCTGRILAFNVCMVVSYVFDSVDGCYARVYNMTSQGGDYYDHGKDQVVALLLPIIVIQRYWKLFSWTTWLVLGFCLIIIYMIACTYLCCVACYKRSKHNTYQYLSGICGDDPYTTIQCTKWFSPTNIFILCMVFINILEYQRQQSRLF